MYKGPITIEHSTHAAAQVSHPMVATYRLVTIKQDRKNIGFFEN